MADNNEELEELEENNEEHHEEEDGVSKEEVDRLRKELENQKKENQKARDALKKSNKEAQDRRHKLKELESVASEYNLDLEDPEQLKSALETYNKQQERSNQKDSDIEKLKKTFEQREQETKKQYEDRLRKMEQSLHENMINAQASSALSAHGVEFPDVLMPHIEKSVSIIQDDDGKYKTRIMDEDGQPKFNSEGDYMGIKDLVDEMKDQDRFAPLFPAKVKSGSGSSPNKSTENKGRRMTNKKQSEFSINEKSEYIGKYGGVKRKVDDVPSFQELPR